MAILVAYDGSRPAQEAVEHAIGQFPDEEIVLLRVVELADSYAEAGIGILRENLKERRRELSEAVSADLDELIDATDIEFRIETAAGEPAREIVRFAEENDITHVVVGNHGRTGVSRVLLGSVAERVVRRSPVPVTVVR